MHIVSVIIHTARHTSDVIVNVRFHAYVQVRTRWLNVILVIHCLRVSVMCAQHSVIVIDFTSGRHEEH